MKRILLKFTLDENTSWKWFLLFLDNVDNGNNDDYDDNDDKNNDHNNEDGNDNNGDRNGLELKNKLNIRHS